MIYIYAVSFLATLYAIVVEVVHRRIEVYGFAEAGESRAGEFRRIRRWVALAWPLLFLALYLTEKARERRINLNFLPAHGPVRRRGA